MKRLEVAELKAERERMEPQTHHTININTNQRKEKKENSQDALTRLVTTAPTGTDEIMVNGWTKNTQTKHQCITAMREYKKRKEPAIIGSGARGPCLCTSCHFFHALHLT